MRDNSGKIILALLAGASAGIVAGLLMAPDSGTVSRDNLKKYAGKLSKDLEKAVQENYAKVQEKVQDNYAKVQENLSKLSDINPGALLGSAGSILGLSKPENGTGAGPASEAGSAAGGGAATYGSTAGDSVVGLDPDLDVNASGSAVGRKGSDASAGNAPKGKAAGGTNPTGAGPEVGEDA